MSQSTLGDWGGGEPVREQRERPAEPIPDCLRPRQFRSYAEPENCYSCPWCFAPPRFFWENAMGETCCSKCTAVIPVEAEWYLRGEKIVYR